jgi:hypothetical protein
VGFAVESRLTNQFCGKIRDLKIGRLLAIRHVFADVRGFSFVEGIAWQLFGAGGLGLRMKK